MENPNTWTLLHWDLSRCSEYIFASLQQKSEALSEVFINHRINTSPEEIAQVIELYANQLEKGFVGKSLIATLVDYFRNKNHAI